MQVSVRELKNHLSQYLHLVEAGKEVIVTSHHTPCAKIVAIHSLKTTTLRSLSQLEGIQWNGKKPKGGGKNSPKISGKTAAEYVLEDR
jgi:prevent-host-death family protein